MRMQDALSPKQREINELMKDATCSRLASIGLAFKDVPVDEPDQQASQAIREGRERRSSRGADDRRDVDPRLVGELHKVVGHGYRSDFES